MKRSIACVMIITVVLGTLPALLDATGEMYYEPFIGAENTIDISEIETSMEGRFIENKGQWDDEIQFSAETPFGHIGLGKGCIFYDIQMYIETDELIGHNDLEYDTFDDAYPGQMDEREFRTGIKGHVLKYTFEGANDVEPTGVDDQETYYNYFIGDDQSRWASNVKCYSSVVYEGLYDDIDLKYYFTDEGPKYDLILEPYADPDDIRIKVEGHNSLEMSNGDLEVGIRDGNSLQDRDLVTYCKEDLSSDLTVDILISNDSGKNYVPMEMGYENRGMFNFFSYDFEDGEEYRVLLNVWDTTGRNTSQVSELFSIENSPFIDILMPEKGEVLTGDYEVFWNAIDPYDNKNSLLVNIWLSDDEGITFTDLSMGEENDGSYFFDTRKFGNGENYLIRLEVKDPTGLSHITHSEIFSIFNNNPPEVYFIGPSVTKTQSGTVRIEWNATDPEDDPDQLLYSLFYKYTDMEIWNQISLDQPNPGYFDLDTFALIEGDGVYSFMISVRDTGGLISEQMIMTLLIYNPDSPVIEYPIGPPLPVRGGTAYFEWRASDPDPNEDQDLKVWLYVSKDEENWILMADGIPNKDEYEMDVTDLEDGDYYAKIRVSDDQGEQYERSTETTFPDKMIVNNKNDPPEVEVIEGPEANVTYKGEIRLRWEGSDADGDNILYTIYYREKGETDWIVIPDARDLDTNTYLWNISDLKEGHYQVRIVGVEDYEDELKSEWISDEFYVKPVGLDIGNEDREVTINSGLLVGIAAGSTVLIVVIVWILFLSARKKPTGDEPHPDDLDPDISTSNKETGTDYPGIDDEVMTDAQADYTGSPLNTDPRSPPGAPEE